MDTARYHRGQSGQQCAQTTAAPSAVPSAPPASSGASSASASASAEPSATAAPSAQPAASSALWQTEPIAAFSGEELVYNETLGDWRTHNGADYAAKAGEDVSRYGAAPSRR